MSAAADARARLTLAIYRERDLHCPNCGERKDHVGMCGECFSIFDKTDGAWPVWTQFIERLKDEHG